MARRYEAACDGGHHTTTTDLSELSDWLVIHRGCRPPHRCVDCGRYAPVLVEDTGLCVLCDGLVMVA